MTCFTRGEIEKILIIAHKIGYNPPQNTPRAPDWRKIADKINSSFSFPMPPDTVRYTGATARDHFENHLNAILPVTSRWINSAVDDPEVKGAIITYNLEA